MSATIIQTIEERMGREPPQPHGAGSAADSALPGGQGTEHVARSLHGAAENCAAIGGDGGAHHSLFQALTNSSGQIETWAWVALCLMVLVLSVLVFLLGRQSKKIRESSMFGSNVINTLSPKSETYIRFAHKPGKNEEYSEFIQDLKDLVGRYRKKDVDVTVTVATKDE